MKIECIKSVVMKNGDKKDQEAFLEGKIYRMYGYNLRSDYDIERVQCAKNEFGERHIIKDKRTDDFFDSHFKTINNSTKPTRMI